uniref:GRIP1 associated protein 1 n=1 Tax=Gasterosteus aculeatus aculeatus TaxID=481459 RepID=G3N4W3_GASAC
MAMSQALSEEEFHRMQTQLLELRTQNYQLSDELRKNSTELNAVRQKNVVLERDFIKAQKALNKSKKAQEVEALLSENEMLQGKLHSQEEDFRLQNSTLMTELSKLCTQIEQLEQENKGLKEGGASSGPPSNPASSPVDGELLRLRAENATLQKKMKGRSERSVEEIVAKQAAIGWSALCPITHCFGPETETKLHPEREGKRLLMEQVQRVEYSYSSSLAVLFPLRVDMLLLLLFTCRTKIDEINQRKEEELKATNIRIQKLQSDVVAANQTTAELREQIQSRAREHEVMVHTLRDQIQTVKTQEVNLLREQQEALTQELHQRRAEREVMSAQRDDLESQLQESSFASRKLLEQLTEEGQEKEKLLRDLEEAKKTAEKRKAMLDEMAIQMNQEKFDHKEAESELKLQHEKEVLGVRARYEKELRGLHEDKNRSEKEIPSAARAKELESLQPRVEELQTQVQSMEGTRGWFERRLKEAEEKIETNSLEHQEEMERVKRGHTLQLEEKQSEMEEVKQQLAEAEKQKDGHKDTIEKLKQEIKDTVDGQRILEKKGSAALKDLKRQLQLERKRADKLQERLQEILTNSKSRTGLEELVLSEINSPSRTQQTGDSSSVSSFSYRDMIKEAQPTNQNKSGGGSPQSQRPAELSDDEVGELFQRLAEVQQEKWMLEEKVKHLEVSCSSMAEDICRKSSIIETYVMESRIGHGGSQGERGSLGSVLRDLVKPGDENLREMNKKLQNMLEEQLTKNMHLQKDLEVLSQELVRLSKDSGAAGSG